MGGRIALGVRISERSRRKKCLRRATTNWSWNAERVPFSPTGYQFSSQTRVFRGRRDGMRCGQCGGEVRPRGGASLHGSAQRFAQAGWPRRGRRAVRRGPRHGAVVRRCRVSRLSLCQRDRRLRSPARKNACSRLGDRHARTGVASRNSSCLHPVGMTHRVARSTATSLRTCVRIPSAGTP
jgi:hypothetical protein